MLLRVVGIATALVLAAGCTRIVPVRAPTVVVVEAVRSRPIASSAASSADDLGGGFRPRDEVEVEWRGSWWPAVVLERRSRARWLVHYEGYGAEWDEVVGADRVRERRAEVEEEEEGGDDDED